MKLLGMTVGITLLVPVLVSMALIVGVAELSAHAASAVGFGVPADGPGILC